MSVWLRRCCLWASSVALVAACGAPTEQTGAAGAAEAGRSGLVEAADDGPSTAESASLGRESPADTASAFGPGFVVWESNRGGEWRIWIRELAGGEPRRLSPDERGRVHCCPHVSPDGRWVAYLSGRDGGREYPAGGMLGELRLIAPNGGGERVVAEAARSYFENRAVVWRSPQELIHIDGERATVLLDLESGRGRRLAEPPAEHGRLIDSTLSWATTGLPEFAPYDASRRAVAPRGVLGGCQPFFSSDGRWGFWTAGAGGPIDRLELGTGAAAGRRGRILDKNDPRVPDGYGYAYFPMLSADGRLFAWAASRGEHDHFTSDYEVFVAESDPDTLELIGAPTRITRSPASDRFPDAWQPPLVLGRHAGEAPLTVRLATPDGAGWRWGFGDGSSGEGATVEHTWRQAGRYELIARRGDEELRGLVVVRPARPPRPLAARALAGGLEIDVQFDEEVDVAETRIELASGAAVAGHQPGADGRSLRISLGEPLRRVDRLVLSGVRDRAQRANTMARAELELEPPAWPVSRQGLVFLWETADAANLVPDAELGADRAYSPTAAGRARLDAAFAMVVDGGSFGLDRAEASGLRAAVQGTNELSLELTLTSRGGDGRIVTWAAKAINMWLQELEGRLEVGLRIGGRGPAAYPRVELFEPPTGEPVHLVVTYEPGRLTAYRDGERVVERTDLQGDFYHWRDLPLLFGDGDWRGSIEGVAIYDRVLAPAEAAEAYRLSRARLEARPPVPRTVVEARLVASSRTPTLAEISPYREALVTVDYTIESTVDGPPVGAELRAAQWAILDGETLPETRRRAGSRLRLTLEPFARQPQLESVYLGDTLGAAGGDLYYVVDAVPVG